MVCPDCGLVVGNLGKHFRRGRCKARQRTSKNIDRKDSKHLRYDKHGRRNGIV